jgi:hypothetical protein
MAFIRATTVLLALLILSVSAGATRADTLRRIYISATDASGAQVTDLTADDVVVKENGKEYPVTSLRRATAPMDIAILVDDNGIGGFQPGVAEFIMPLGGRARFRITNFIPQAVVLTDYTADFDNIQAALNNLGRRGRIRGDGEQLVQDIDSTVRTMQQTKPERPVMLVITVDGDVGARNPDLVMPQIHRSGVIFNVVHVSNARIGLILGDAPRETGGRIERVGSVNAVGPAVKRIAASLLNQFALTYTLPDGVKLSDRVSVTTTRSGITLLAPTRISDR